MILHKEEILWGMGGHLPSFPNLLIGPNAVTPTRVSALANIKYVDISRKMQIEVLQSELLFLRDAVFSIILIIGRVGVSRCFVFFLSSPRFLFNYMGAGVLPCICVLGPSFSGFFNVKPGVAVIFK